MQWPLILTPVHIVFLELIIDPSCTLIFEADKEERDVMKHKPRSVDAKLFDRAALLNGFSQGGLTLLVTLTAYWFVRRDHSVEAARALAFMMLVVCNLGMILTNRSLSLSGISMLREKNAAFKWVVGGTIILLGLIMTVPFLMRLFRFGVITWDDFAIVLLGAFISIVIMEIAKKFILSKVSARQ
jgi:Ca2+-transporting ATPase